MGGKGKKGGGERVIVRSGFGWLGSARVWLVYELTVLQSLNFLPLRFCGQIGFLPDRRGLSFCSEVRDPFKSNLPMQH